MDRLCRCFAQSLKLTTARAYATAAQEAPIASTSAWTPASRRTGVIARKQGMTAIYDADGIRVPVTVLQLQDTQVVGVRTTPFTALQVGCTNRRIKTVSNSVRGQARKAGVDPKMRIGEFKVSEDAILSPGTTISAAHFVPGQYVDVQGKTIGKGFAGAMKRHGFGGLRASHGVSISHRSHGSTGQHQDPGRVFPGKKMAGHMGNVNRTTQNLLIMRVDLPLNLVFVKGCVAGSPGTFVRVSDAVKKPAKAAGSVPYPVGDVDLAKTLPEIVQLERSRKTAGVTAD